MKRDMDLVRRLLLIVEDQKAPGMVEIKHEENSFDSLSPIYKHWPLLSEAGLIVGNVSNNGMSGDCEVYYMDCELTWKGHDFLDSVRDPEIWKKTKDGAIKAGGWTFDIVGDLAKGFIKKQIEDRTGVKL